MGSAISTLRTAEQTDIARFWASSLPNVYTGIVQSYVTASPREITRNARLYAAVTAAMNDADIAQFETKYHYQFWRPITAIRNGDRDDNPKTDRDPDWVPLTATPMQPEYPCGNCVFVATVLAVIRADADNGPLPTLSTQSNTAPGLTRRWSRTKDLIQEVSEARIHAGVHYRNSPRLAPVWGNKWARSWPHDSDCRQIRPGPISRLWGRCRSWYDGGPYYRGGGLACSQYAAAGSQ